MNYTSTCQSLWNILFYFNLFSVSIRTIIIIKIIISHYYILRAPKVALQNRENQIVKWY